VTDELTVAVTGPTGDIGKAVLRALEATPEVARVVAMARSPFDPSTEGLTKVEYIQGDILDRAAVNKLVDGADVVIHLAFLIFGKADKAKEINIDGSRNVFEATFEAGAKRLIYTSSVAAYGFHDDHPLVLTEEVATRGSDDHYYSSQKAATEKMLSNLGRNYRTEVYVFRPCIVAGPTALSLIEEIPYVKITDKLPERAKKFIGNLPALRPVVPDPGTPFQLVHEDDVADALVLASLGKGEPGAYNLAGDGKVTASDVAHALGWYAIPLPEIAIGAAARIISKMPLMPATVKWGGTAIRVPLLMDCMRAKRKLGWQPKYDALHTLAETVAGAREAGLIPWPDQA
jgi:UDP-glucose 4-epimerase